MDTLYLMRLTKKNLRSECVYKNKLKYKFHESERQTIRKRVPDTADTHISGELLP